MAVGWNGMYIISDNGKKIEKLESVAYAKSVGYGAPEKAGGENTLFIYGKPTWDDVDGIYRSTDGGKTWVCINTDHLYGGTGNGNFLVGDMDEFGTVYMSTVGCGIIYGRLASNSTQPFLEALQIWMAAVASPSLTLTIAVGRISSCRSFSLRKGNPYFSENASGKACKSVSEGKRINRSRT